MHYSDFKDNLKDAHITLSELAEYLNIPIRDLRQFAKQDSVPDSFAFLSFCLKEWGKYDQEMIKKIRYYQYCRQHRQIDFAFITEPREKAEQEKSIRPFLRWTGTSREYLEYITKCLPSGFSRAVFPTIGGGSLYFALKPSNAIISDPNPAIGNLYQVLATDPDALIQEIQQYSTDKTFFYQLKKKPVSELNEVQRAARTLVLNNLCLSGMYPEDRDGNFNGVYGKIKHPFFLKSDVLLATAKQLQKCEILPVSLEVLFEKLVREGDFIYLDLDCANFSPERFDFAYLKNKLKAFQESGIFCMVILSDSFGNPEQFSDFTVAELPVRAHVYPKGPRPEGKDYLVVNYKTNYLSENLPEIKKEKFDQEGGLPTQVDKFPATRFMGSKQRLLTDIYSILKKVEFDSALDLFSGSGAVAYLLKSMGKKVVANDYMHMNYLAAKALIVNNDVTLDTGEARLLTQPLNPTDQFVSKTFDGLYFSPEDNRFIDQVRANIKVLPDGFKKDIATLALIRACLKKRPRGIFSYVGIRYDDGRRDLRLSFEEQFIEAVRDINKAVFNNGKDNLAFCEDSLEFEGPQCDLVYLDPPYFSKFSDNQYVRRYHFIEGLARDWSGVEIQEDTQTKKFKSYPTAFASKKLIESALQELFERYKRQQLLISYSSNSIPSQEFIVDALKNLGKEVELFPVDIRYGFGNQKKDGEPSKSGAQEFLFLAY